MLNIVIPMAGLGSRFAQAGFSDPKPFIPVAGVPMIELVIRNLRPSRPHRFIFVCQEIHLQHYDYRPRLQLLAPECEVLGLAEPTSGALCTVLAAAKFIDNDTPLMIANADQWVDIDIDDYLLRMDDSDLDGLMMTMPAIDPKWSYARFDSQGRVCEVIEKRVVSTAATVGIYNFRRGRDFCRFAREMVARDERTLGEFYVAPVYTKLYRHGLTRLDVYDVGSGMHGLGTPDDLQEFLQHPVLARALCGTEA
ncbi:glycosyltransferase family 2 protein [Enterobacter cloacae]|uniref:glycosyltransferase family 2 protein n=1 Tax=Enterobacter cloacae TaxID=550 RepID=UPI0033606FD1